MFFKLEGKILDALYILLIINNIRQVLTTKALDVLITILRNRRLG